MRVLLVSMPCASVERPPLGITLLLARLRAVDVPCDVAYLNLAFAELVGLDDYRTFVGQLPHASLAGDWAFAASLFGHAAGETGPYVRDILRARFGLSDELVALTLRIRSLAPGFLDQCLRETPWSDYDLVGFTACGPQNVASLALAQRVKAAHPHVVIAAGGGDWHGEMGIELHRRFPAVDLAFTGEGDQTFPAAVLALSQTERAPFMDLPGVVVRVAGKSHHVGPAQAVRDLDESPLPDYADYFAALRDHGILRSIRPALQMETARGCPWAENGPCLFCGLTGSSREYRSKSGARILAELRHVASFDCSLVEIVDNVVSPVFLSEVLPELVAEPLGAPLFFEARPDLTEEQVRLMGLSRASVQPGIESLSDHVLQLMHKGSRALEGVRLLKWCRAWGVRPYWNLIYGTPGETVGDYEEMLSMVPAITFLQPPLSQGSLSLDRFSPFFERPDHFGFTNVRPLAAYRYVYPLPQSSLAKIAHAYEYDYRGGAEQCAAAGSLQDEVSSWQDLREAGELRCEERPDGLRLVDTRPGARAHVWRLDRLTERLYREAENIATETRLLAAGRQVLADATTVRRRLDDLVGDHLMVRSGGRYLSLALAERTGIRNAAGPSH
jgi:ribosomal peptide maturation radical SAM protein 1